MRQRINVGMLAVLRATQAEAAMDSSTMVVRYISASMVIYSG